MHAKRKIILIGKHRFSDNILKHDILQSISVEKKLVKSTFKPDQVLEDKKISVRLTFGITHTTSPQALHL